MNGHNPLRWDCEKQGCFNKKCRPKIEQFAECLPGRIAFSDVDGIVEINGNFLLLEWKSFLGDIPDGQRIMYEQMTQNDNFTVVIIAGNAETMEIQSVKVVHKGCAGKWQVCTLKELKDKIRAWSTRVKRRKQVAAATAAKWV